MRGVTHYKYRYIDKNSKDEILIRIFCNPELAMWDEELISTSDVSKVDCPDCVKKANQWARQNQRELRVREIH